LDQSFWDQHGDLISGIVTILGAIIIALIVDRVLIARTRQLAARISAGGKVAIGTSRASQTRLRVIRRLVFLTILMLGVAFALRNVKGAEKLATGILASSALIGVILGFAARDAVANLVAGVLMAFAQPIRIGDRVTITETGIGSVTGRVDDITLTFTYIDPGDGRLLIVPNEQVVTNAMFNHSTGNLSSPVTVSLWVPPDADIEAARSALDGIAEQIQVAEITHEGVRLEAMHTLDGDRTRVGGEEAALRERAQSALRQAGILDSSGN
jgi:small-conductance mechanosensitive channel